MNKKYKFWIIFATIITATIGSSLISSFSFLMFLSEGNPVIIVLSFIIGGLIIIPELIITMEPSLGYGESGSAYVYIKKTRFQALAFWFGWILVVMVSATAIASTTMALGNIVANLIGQAGVDFSEAGAKWSGKAIGLGILVILFLLQTFIRNLAGMSQIFFTVIKSLPILLIFILAIVVGKQSNFHSGGINNDLQQAYASSAAMIPAIAYTAYAYSGTEIGSYFIEDIENPKKNLFLGTLVAVVVIMLIYTIYAVAIISLGGDKNTSVIPNDLAQMPEWSKLTFQILCSLVFVGSLNSFLFYQSAVTDKMAYYKDCFQWFNKKHPKTGARYPAMLMLIGVACIYIFTNDLFAVINYFTFATCLLRFILNFTIIWLRYKDKNYVRIFNNWTFIGLMVFNTFAGIIMIGGSLYISFAPKFSSDGNYVWSLIYNAIILVIAIGIYPIGYVLKNFKIENKKIVRIKRTEEETKDLV